MMPDDMFVKLKRSLIKHEGFRTSLYEDSVGKQTIGIGYCIGDRGLSTDWVNKQFQEDVDYFYNELSKNLWFQACNLDRQIVLIDMAFMGLKKFYMFQKMIDALKRKDYKTAAQEMLQSEWSKQVGQRAIDLATAMKEGIYNI